MKMSRIDFELLTRQAMLNPDVAHLGPVVRKELLHYDILFSLERDGLLKSLVFQGGTSLRLCYGSQRYSEDLDFAGGREFSSDSLKDVKAVLEDYMGNRYGLEILVKEPPERKQELNHSKLRVDKWTISVITEPERRDIPKQRINIEICNIPAHSLETHQVRQNYPFMPDGYNNILIGVESPDEIMADKLLFLAATNNIRYRDIWDLSWLNGQGIRVRPDLVKAKINDYGVKDFRSSMDNIVERCFDIIESDEFRSQMYRFLPEDVFKNNIGGKGPREAIYRAVTGLYRDLERQMA